MTRTLSLAAIQTSYGMDLDANIGRPRASSARPPRIAGRR
jgi:hypothetical protein